MISRNCVKNSRPKGVENFFKARSQAKNLKIAAQKAAKQILS